MNSCHNCASSRKVYAIVKDDKLYRLTFSQSLADHILTLKPEYEIKRVEFTVGKKLKEGEESQSGLYGITDKRKGLILRIAMQKEMSDILCDGNWRYPSEIYLSKLE